MKLSRLKTFFAAMAILIGAASAAGADAPQLTKVENMTDAAGVNVRLRISGKVEHSVFTLDNPARLVIDLAGADTQLAKYHDEFNGKLLSGIRVGKPTPESVRVVLDLAYLLPYTVEEVPGTNDLLIVIGRKFETKVNTVNVLKGITYTAKLDMTPAGPMTTHVLDINMNEPGISLFVGIGEDKLGGREKLSALVKRKGAAIGINGGYFSMDSGLPIDLLVFKGKVLLLPDRYRGFFGIDSTGATVFMRPNTDISIKIAGDLKYVHRLNWPPQKGEMAVFTPEYGKTTRTEKGRKEIIIRKNKITEFTGGDAEIPTDGVVLSTDEKHKDIVALMKKGDEAVLTISSYPDIKNIMYGFSAGPMLVKDGVVESKFVEDFTVSSGIIADRNPRTAVGRTNNNHLIFVVVEGRNTRSAGMTLEELGALMKSLDAHDAINLDGGGSSEMVIGGKIVNELPKGEERPIANAVLIYHK